MAPGTHVSIYNLAMIYSFQVPYNSIIEFLTYHHHQPIYCPTAGHGSPLRIGYSPPC